MTGHRHDWRPDGESWTEYTCSHETLEAIYGWTERPDCDKSCKTRYRRYTCHCGEKKKVEYDQ